MKTKKKWIAIGLFFSVLAGALGALVVFFPNERIRTMAQTEATKAAGVPVKIAGVGLSLFPLGVSLQGVQVGEENRPAPVPYVHLKSLSIGVELLPLLQKKVRVSHVSLVEPKIVVFQSDQPAPTPPKPTSGASSGSSDFSVSLSKLTIRDAQIRVLNPDRSEFIALEGLDETLSADLTTSGVLRLEGELSIARMALRLPTGTLGQGLTLRFAKKITVDPAKESLVIDRGDLWLGDLPLALTGSVNDWSKDRMRLDLALKGGPANIKSILGYLPAKMFPQIDGIQSQGSLAIEGFAKGSFSQKEGPVAAIEKKELDFSAKLALRDGRLNYPALPTPIEGIALIVEATPNLLRLDSFSAKTARSQVSLHGSVANYLRTPNLDLTASVRADLQEAQAMQPKGSAAKISGKASVDAKVKGTADKPMLSGQVDLSGIGYHDPALGFPALEGLNASMLLSNDLVLIRSFAGKIGKSDFAIQGKLSDFEGLVSTSSAKKRARFEVSMNSKNLDLDELMPAATEPAPQSSTPTDLTPIRRIDGTVALSARQALFNRLSLQNVVGKATLRDGVFDLREFSMGVFGGSIRLSGLANFQKPKRPTFDLKLGIQKIQAAPMLEYASNLNQFGQLGGALAGALSTEVTFRGALDESLNLDMNRLSSKGIVDLMEAKISGHPVQTKLSSMLDAPSLKSLSLSNLKIPFEIKDGKIDVDGMKLGNKDVSAKVTGWQAIDGTSKFAMDVDLPQKWATGIKNSIPAPARSLLFTNPESKISLPLLMTGQLVSPSLSLDQGRVASSVDGKAKAAVATEAKKLKEDTVKKALKGKKPDDKLKKAIKKLF